MVPGPPTQAQEPLFKNYYPNSGAPYGTGPFDAHTSREDKAGTSSSIATCTTASSTSPSFLCACRVWPDGKWRAVMETPDGRRPSKYWLADKPLGVMMLLTRNPRPRAKPSTRVTPLLAKEVKTSQGKPWTIMPLLTNRDRSGYDIPRSPTRKRKGDCRCSRTQERYSTMLETAHTARKECASRRAAQI